MLQMILGVLGSSRMLIPLILVGVMGVGWFWNVSKYKNQLEDKKVEITSLKQDIERKEKEILKQELVIATERNNVELLKHEVEKSNEYIKNNEVLEAELRNEIEKWKNNKPAEVVKYVEKIVKVKDHNNITLQECKQVNESISKIKYEDL
nr:MAG TPA: hypothetical protein [Caudoviricetes sp.]